MATYHHNGHDSKCHCDMNINTGSVDTITHHDSNNHRRNMDNQAVIWHNRCSINQRKMLLNPANLVCNPEVQLINNAMVPIQSKPLLTGVPLYRLCLLHHPPTNLVQPHTTMCNIPHSNIPSPHHEISTQGCNIPHINANIFIHYNISHICCQCKSEATVSS